MSINDFAAGSGMAWNDWFIAFMRGYGLSPREGGIPFSPPGFTSELAERWVEATDPANAAPLKVVTLGDSILLYEGLNSFNHHLSALLNQRAKAGSIQRASYPIATLTTGQGTQGTTTTTGGGGVTLTAGEKRLASHVITGSRLTVVYASEDGGTGELTLRNGAGGTVLGVIDVDDPSDSPGQIWGSAAVTVNAPIEIENTGTGAATIENIMVHEDNYTSGVQVWDIARTGSTPNNYFQNPVTYIPFLQNLDPDIILVELGTNGVANYEELLDSLREVCPNATLAPCVVYKNNQITWSEIEDIREINSRYAMPIDFAGVLGDASNQTFDGVHPIPWLSVQIAKIAGASLSGDPFAAMAYEVYDLPLTGSRLELGGVSTSTSLLAWPDPTDKTVTWGDVSMVLGSPPNLIHHQRAHVLWESTEPSAPAAGSVILYSTSAGLYAKFPDGTTVQLAAKP